MVLPPPSAHALPVEARWFDGIVVAIELAARGVLTLVDHAAPARLREAYLRLRARDPATEVIVDVRRLDELPVGATAILALKPPLDDNSLDWLNLNRPILSERRLNVVLWCMGDAAAALAWRAPDFFDWISARVDCPRAPAAHAVAEVRRAICARASGIAWDGPGLEETLAVVRPGRPVRRVMVASYQSMIDALTSRERGWLFLEGIETEFHLRRLRWAIAETGRRVIVFRRAFEHTAPGWWTVRASHESVLEAVHALTAAGGSGRLAALTGLDPDAWAYARFALCHGIEPARLEALLVAAAEPRVTLQELVQQAGWTASEVIAQDDHQQTLDATRQAFEREAARRERDGDPVVRALHDRPSRSEQWAELGTLAMDAGDFEIAIQWLTAAKEAFPAIMSPRRARYVLALREQAYRSAGDLASAHADFELANTLSRERDPATAIAETAISVAYELLERGALLEAHDHLLRALILSMELGGEAELADLHKMLAEVLLAQGNLSEARRELEQALAIQGRIATEDHPSSAATLSALGSVLAKQGDLAQGRHYLERSLEMMEEVWGAHHPAVAVTLRRLAEVDLATGDVASARARLERALSILQVTLGSRESSVVADTLVVQAHASAADGDLDGAQALLDHALAIQQKVSGNGDPLAGATTRRALASILVAKGDLAGAIENLERALATLQRSFKREDHPDIEATRREVDRLQRLQGELQRTD